MMHASTEHTILDPQLSPTEPNYTQHEAITRFLNLYNMLIEQLRK